MSSHRTIEGYEDEAPVNGQAHSEKTKLFFLVMHSHFTGLPPVFATQLILSGRRRPVWEGHAVQECRALEWHYDGRNDRI